jgi:BioD-like phosphotransacetylase family protein
MKTIFLISNRPYSGRNLLAVGLSLNLKERGKKVGYMKLLGKTPIKVGDKILDEESMFIHKVLEIEDPVEWVCPFVLSYEAKYKLFHEEEMNIAQQIREVINTQTTLKDYLFVVGGDSIFEGLSLGIDCLRLIKEVDAKGINVQLWEGETSVDDILGVKELLGKNFVGAVINKVPPEEHAYIKETVVPYLKKKGVEVLGVFKRDRLLEAITVRTLLEVVNGGIACCEDKLEEFIENIVIGAMDPENAMRYFLKIPNKLVITGVYRTDIQILALETSTKCLLLTGGLHPSEMVISIAKSKGVPVVVTSLDTFSAVKRIQSLVGRDMLKDRGKALRAKEVVAKEFDLDRFLAMLEV